MTFSDIVELVIQLSRYTSIPGIVFFLLFSKKLNIIPRILFFILLASFLSDFLGYAYSKYVFPNNHPIINVWHFTNCLLVTYLFYKAIPFGKKLISAIMIGFILITIASFAFVYSFSESNTVVWTFSNLIVIGLSVRTYFSLLKNPSVKLKVFPVFWMTTAVFIFSSVTLLIFLFQHYLVFDLNISKVGFKSILLIINLANISKNFILFYAIILIDKGHPASLKPVNAT